MEPAYPAVYTAATMFAHSYDQSMEVYRQGAPIEVFAATLATYYKPSSFTGFWGGNAGSGLNNSAMVAGIARSVAFLDKSGYGHDLRMTKLRVEPHSEEGAAVWITWKIKPKNGAEPWEWETLYGYRLRDAVVLQKDGTAQASGPTATPRQTPGGINLPEGWWEFTVTDNEVTSFLKRIPNYLDSYTS